MNIKHLLSMTLAALALVSAGTAPAQAEEPEETWKDVGEGTLRDDLLTSYYNFTDYLEFPVTMQESEQTPGRYRLVDAYKNCPSVGGEALPEGITNYIIVDASDPEHVYLQSGNASYCFGKGENAEGNEVSMWLNLNTVAYDYYRRYGNWTIADKEGICGKLREGAITFPAYQMLLTGAFEPDGTAADDDMWMRGNINGMFRLKLPGTPDTDIDLALVGINEAGTEVSYTVALPAGVEYVKLALFEGQYTEDMRGKVENDEVTTQRVDQLATVTFPFEKDGIYTLVAVPYIDGKSWAPSYVTSEWAYSQDEWKNIGKAQYTEAILSSNIMNEYGFMIDEYQYEVPVQQNVSNPSRIRLVDPYGPDCHPRANATTYDTSKHYYLVFDLTYYDMVNLEHAQNIGLNLGMGTNAVRSTSDLYLNGDPLGAGSWTIEQFLESGMPRGHYDADSKTITYDKGGIRLEFSANPTAWYECNLNQHFKLTLPSDIEVPASQELPESGIAGIEADNAKAEYYTLDGVKVSSTDLNSGIYIMRRGGKTSKVMVK